MLALKVAGLFAEVRSRAVKEEGFCRHATANAWVGCYFRALESGAKGATRTRLAASVFLAVSSGAASRTKMGDCLPG